MPNFNNELAQEELILAEAQVVRAKRKERDLKLSLNGLTLDEVMNENYEQVLAHEEKILAQENYVLKLRDLRGKGTEQSKGIGTSSMEEFIQGIVSFFGLEEGEAVVFLDPKSEFDTEQDVTCLVCTLLNKVEEIEEQVAQMTVENTKDVLKKLISLKEFIIENTENINIR